MVVKKCNTGLKSYRHEPFYTCQLGVPCARNNAAHVHHLVMTIINYIREGRHCSSEYAGNVQIWNASHFLKKNHSRPVSKKCVCVCETKRHIMLFVWYGHKMSFA